MADIRPTNYRTHHFHLFDRDLSIGGMAGPHHNTDRKGALNYLSQHEKSEVLIGLHETDFSKDANENGLEYHFIPIPDFISSPVSPEKYDAIYSAVKKATEEGKGVTIHCGAGDGRTGTALACLKLRELMEKAAREDVRSLDESPNNITTVYATRVHDRNVPCTPLVKAAVEELRQQRTAIDESGSHSVETENEIHTLIEYEKHLRLVIKEELLTQKDTAPVPPRVERGSTASISLLLAGDLKKARDHLKHTNVSESDDVLEKKVTPAKKVAEATEKDVEETQDPRP